jgi:hypothetical protein
LLASKLQYWPELCNVSVLTFRDTVEGSFDQRFATLKSIGEDRVNDRELELLLKRKSAPICYVWCDPSPWMHISEVYELFFVCGSIFKCY